MKGKCRVCGCDDNHACVTSKGPCRWVESDLCSACSDLLKRYPQFGEEDLKKIIAEADALGFNRIMTIRRALSNKVMDVSEYESIRFAIDQASWDFGKNSKTAARYLKRRLRDLYESPANKKMMKEGEKARMGTKYRS